MEEGIIKLRRLTGLGISECKRAFELYDGDIEKAYAWLREKWSGVWTIDNIRYENNL